MTSGADGLGSSFVGGNFELNTAVIKAIPGAKIISSHAYGQWVWAQQAKLLCRLADGTLINYFLKVTQGENDRVMIEGQFESDKAIHQYTPSYCPEPLTWGKYESSSGPDRYFLLAEFREVGQQPPEPLRFTALLADLHKRSVSPTGKFGFHTTTCHGNSQQLTDCWEESWEVLYRKQLAFVFQIDHDRQPDWPEYEYYAQLVLEKSVEKLLRPLQSEGRTIKPCLVHGGLWDGNTATDMESGEPFVFDSGAFYAHNEYELGNWRTPGHRLSGKSYIRSYKKHFPASEPEEDWDSRNLLYSLRFNVTSAYLVPGSNYRENVFEDLKELCRRTCPDEVAEYEKRIEQQKDGRVELAQGSGFGGLREEPGEEEEEEEEEEDEEEEDEEEEEEEAE